jgi:hypothetical protein
MMRIVAFVAALVCIVVGLLTGLFELDTNLSALAWFVAAIAIALVFRGAPE